MSSTRVIPTRYKSKLPGDRSYPVGAEAISRALAESPQFGALQLRFIDGHWPASDFRKTLESGEPYVVLRVSYSPKEKPGYRGGSSLIEEGYFEERWSVEVYPVLRSARALARRLLLADGLPAVAGWMVSLHHEADPVRYRHIEVLFDRAGEAIAVRERIRP